jgi:hypothetical protein
MSCGINHQVGVKASPEEIYKYLLKRFPKIVLSCSSKIVRLVTGFRSADGPDG